MKRLFIPTILLLAFTLVMGGCATTRSISLTTELQNLVNQLEDLSTGAIEAKRAVVIAILDGWLFDAGFWGIILEKGKLRPDPEVVDSLKQLTCLSTKRDELTDFEMGQVLAHYVIIVRATIKYGIQEIVPQAMQLLAMF